MVDTGVTTLLTRLGEATVGTRELDAEIIFDLYAKPVGTSSIDGGPTSYRWLKDNLLQTLGIRFPGKKRTRLKELRKGCSETIIIKRDGAFILMNHLLVPHLTTDICAALILVPYKRIWKIHSGTQQGISAGEVNSAAFINGGPEYPDVRHTGYASTEALAICIAALRARGASF